MGTAPTLEHESAAPRLVDEVTAPRMVSFAGCENCGSSNVFSTLVTTIAIYWQCQTCAEVSVTKRDLL